jgi:hypothetical protein
MSDGGKGSSPRPYSVDQTTFANNWETIFGKKTPQEIDDAKAEDEAFAILERQKREKALDELVRINQELGLYDEYDRPNDITGQH